jgi:hypothetical protein
VGCGSQRVLNKSSHVAVKGPFPNVVQPVSCTGLLQQLAASLARWALQTGLRFSKSAS